MRVGAPLDLVQDSMEAGVDEARHAKAAFALAGGSPPGRLEIDEHDALPTVQSILLSSIKEGGVTEYLGVLRANKALRDPTLPSVERLFYEMVAVDEARHVKLAWRVVNWCLDQAPELDELARTVLETTLREHAVEATVDDFFDRTQTKLTALA